MILPLAKNIQRYFSTKRIAVALLAIAATVLLGVFTFSAFSTNVIIDNNGTQITVKTMRNTVKDVLTQSGIEVSDFDYVSLPLDMRLIRNKTTRIHIKSAVPINVFADGKETTVMTSKNTVKEALQASTVGLGVQDRIEGVNPNDKVYKNMKVKVVRVRQEKVSQNEIIPYGVQKKANSSMDRGVEEVISKGKNGVCEKTYMVVYEDNKEIKRQLLTNTIVSEPEKEVVEYGTIATYTASRGDTIRYKKILEMSATAYTASYRDTKKHPGDAGFGITYTGLRVKRGIVAVDPKVIPLGTRLYIEGIGNTPDYGYAVAADIGSAIKGNKIDLYMDGQKVVDNWGRKKVKVYILY
ncbi:3D domain-containing protein [Acetivibrio cellulolyticus]|uniref:3D domain-containing protein n=1 Tax=Acetivibrio cellulolyticus TaxID=35830 RepID=UPI0001E2DE95|nr:3D domain-containing protein [Acetivibrio cellulolyticus]